MSTEKAIGCMIGSAYGDSLGAAVEFDTLDGIREIYGEQGITRLESVYGHPAGAITDDTQMAIATAEGIVNVLATDLYKLGVVTNSIWESYLDWYDSQSEASQRRAPGNTCLSALASGKMGSAAAPLNYSSGCGAIMRAHPAGIAYADNFDYAFEVGAASGAITHGNPNGYMPAAFFSHLIAELMQGEKLESAISGSVAALERQPSEQHQGTLTRVRQALWSPRDGDSGEIIDAQVGQSPSGGGGWQGHDALAIALYAAVRSPEDPLEAIRIAVNHSGDSDSTGAIAGAIVGAMHGPEVFENALNEQAVELEHKVYLGELAVKLVAVGKARNGHA